MNPDVRYRWLLWLIGAAIAASIGLLAVPLIAGWLRCHHFRQESNSYLQLGNLRSYLVVYQVTHKELPPPFLVDDAGTPTASWRLLILRQYRQSGLDAYDLKKPWSDPVNLAFKERGAERYWWGLDGERGQGIKTSWLAVTGPDTAFERRVYSGIPGDAILVFRVADCDVMWLEPKDLPIEELRDPARSAEWSQRLIGKNGALVLFADYQRWLLRPDVPLESLLRFCTVMGAREYDREAVLGPYRSAVPRSQNVE